MRKLTRLSWLAVPLNFTLLFVFLMAPVPIYSQQKSHTMHPKGTPGELHNQGVRFVLSRMKEVPKGEKLKEVVVELTRQYFASIKHPVPEGITVPDIPADRGTAVNNLSASDALKTALKSVLALRGQHPKLRDFKSALNKLERDTTRTLPVNDRERFSHAVSIARSSAEFWAPVSEGGMNGIKYLRVKGFTPSTDRLSWWEADMIGCMACWEFLLVGCFFCAVGASVVNALI